MGKEAGRRPPACTFKAMCVFVGSGWAKSGGWFQWKGGGQTSPQAGGQRSRPSRQDGGRLPAPLWQCVCLFMCGRCKVWRMVTLERGRSNTHSGRWASQAAKQAGRRLPACTFLAMYVFVGVWVAKVWRVVTVERCLGPSHISLLNRQYRHS